MDKENKSVDSLDIVLTDDEVYIAKTFSEMIGKVLSLIDTSLPPEGGQCKMLKRLVSNDMYATRNLFYVRYGGRKGS